LASAFERLSESLDAIASSPVGVTVSEFAAKLRVNKSTASRLLQGLAEAGIAEKAPLSQRYVLGLKVWSLGVASRNGHRVLDVAMAPMIQFVQLQKVPLNIAVNRRGETFYLLRFEWMSDSVVVLPAGARPPAHANASGKALLAFGPEAQVEGLVSRGLKGLTPNTITDGARLRDELVQARAAGYARNVAELREGHCGIAFPIFDFTGAPVAAVSAACTLEEWNTGFEERVAAPLRELARAISRYMGFETAVPAAGVA
jgi:IclR family transcriptional regulator, KDG regulon repressor